MKAKVTKEFNGRPDNEALTQPFKVGDIVEGDLARVAIDNKWAEEYKEEPTKKSDDAKKK